MSGHSKWHSIKHKKGAADAARGAVFTRHVKLISVAAREGGGDPSMNPALRVAIEKAKADNMPNANIDRAVKKGTGELGGGAQMMENIYEGYGPGGIAILVSTLTDNKNRTVSSVRSTFGKLGGNMGESGSVAWMFKKKGILTVETTDEDGIMMAALDAGATDVEFDDGVATITCEPNDVPKVNDTLAASGFTVLSAEASMVPDTTIEITDLETAKKIMRLVDTLEEDEDVTSVAGNFDIPESILEQMGE